MTDWLVTANLAGPSASADVRAAVHAWGAEALARKPAFAFVQELPSDEWLAPWKAAGYGVVTGIDRGWRVRSAILFRAGLEVTGLTENDHQNLKYHGEYVASARWRSARGDVLLASVHASPNEADPEKYGWSGDLPEPRTGGDDPRHVGGRLWDSDLVLATLTALSQQGSIPLLAAGDLNEALDYDLDETGQQIGSWGREYFKRARQGGLAPWLHDVWDRERPTRGRWQLDHVLVSAADDLLDKDPAPQLDSGWTGPEASRSDHAPIWVAINPSWVTPS